MSKTYILIDTFNMFHRAKHVIRSSSLDEKVGMCLHVMFNSIRKVYRDHSADHAVFCIEGKSWRKDFYKEYKFNRTAARMARTEAEIEEDAALMEAYNDLITFINDKTNSSVLHHHKAEADDMIATWIQNNPNDNHIIVSSDSDFFQLLAPNVKIYNGITEQLITLEGFFDNKGKPVIDNKTKKPKVAPDPKWLLFEKCIRGDKSDFIFAAYPGARETSSKNKVGMREVFADMDNKGYAWNNFMLTKITDSAGNEFVVHDKYEFNKTLIDLTCQPDDLKTEFKTVTDVARNKPPVSNVGIHFLKFCNRWALEQISKYPDEFAKLLNAKP
ncbi:RNaseH ribonuclease [Pseudomonas phage vB_PaeM_PA5oct]|uniref:RNaseH ribonuclease n=1 Tax=Pseudomonas phage vB_PaeM_PA5oct TaxID=2163605 RepID=A0A4Y5JU39_9CAUD|nr:exonuclease [Pseudomonas phage vB_PaeM_PA5oct]QCG76206.1 RNaseH ribonuclease [Pseudomonas phage vB_PaeM_PA5oct]WPK40354.1 exonuclease [Pseudomonas phage Paride]